MERKEDIGPEKVSFATFLLKMLAAGVGGAGGGLLLFVIFLTTSTFFADAAADNASPIFTFIVLIMAFLGSLFSNILSVWLLGLTEKGKYTKISSAIYQVFIVSIIILLLMVPVYLISVGTDISYASYVSVLHIMIAAQASALILEIISNYRYALVGVYGVTFAFLISTGILVSLSRMSEEFYFIVFLAPLVVWVSIAIIHTLTTILYGWFARTYDKDFLSTQTVYGADYGREVEDVEEEAPKAKDESGADFLRHN